MENDTPGTGEPAPQERLRDRSMLMGNLLTVAAGLISVVQALRADSWWPLWVAAGGLTLAGVLAYRLRQRRWRAAAVSLAALLLLGGGGVLLAVTRPEDRQSGTPAAVGATGVAPPSDAPATGAVPSSGAPTSGAPVPGGPTSAGTAPTNPAVDVSGTPAATAAGTVFSDVVQLDKKTGVDLDGGRAVRRYAQDATVDLYLDWGYILYSSARHSAMYDDSYQGPEEGADARCRTYREAERDTFPHKYIGGGNQQYCFTTSEGHPGWVQAVNTVGDGGLILKVTVWAG
ncbi:hypothetical protein [Micromonospora thermarum]|uniref:Uncharacterized protein n=1 Tax=Micromonospora thermarum TaxID=2720024 RepID=A0ABX0ZAH0_9ACTN|nr:hypothetical protein [Micromonospora thermarum]NJP34207.1 hypothetical protein [Micromonospora thermarum]